MKITAKVLNIDSVPDCWRETFLKEGISFSETVPLVFMGEQEVGTAALNLTENALMAEATITDPIIQKLLSSAWKTNVKIIPSVSGYVWARDEINPKLLSKVEIRSISLNLTENSDPRIEPLRFVPEKEAVLVGDPRAVEGTNEK